MKRTFTYENVLVTHVTDGDTFKAEVDFGFSIKGNFIFRLHNVDTPETYRPSCEAELVHGLKASKFVRNLIEGKTVKIKVYKLAIYGRYECDVWLEDGRDLVQLIKDNGLEKLDSYPADKVD